MPNPLQYFLLFLLALPCLAVAQENEEHIDWVETRKLSWEDFKSRPDPNSGAAASTTTYLGLEYSITPMGVTYEIACRFSTQKSWGLHKTDYILAHEQGHFDIAEIFARRLHQRISSYEFNSLSYKQDLRKIYLEVMTEKETWQKDYDEQTNHSIRWKEQKEWEAKIKNELAIYRDYANYRQPSPKNQVVRINRIVPDLSYE